MTAHALKLRQKADDHSHRDWLANADPIILVGASNTSLGANMADDPGDIFSYAELPADDATWLRQTALALRVGLRKTVKGLIEIGRAHV